MKRAWTLILLFLLSQGRNRKIILLLLCKEIHIHVIQAQDDTFRLTCQQQNKKKVTGNLASKKQIIASTQTRAKVRMGGHFEMLECSRQKALHGRRITFLPLHNFIAKVVVASRCGWPGQLYVVLATTVHRDGLKLTCMYVHTCTQTHVSLPLLHVAMVTVETE